jgi:hypothetical protein
MTAKTFRYNHTASLRTDCQQSFHKGLQLERANGSKHKGNGALRHQHDGMTADRTDDSLW